MTLGEKLKALRHDKNLTQTEAAHQIGIAIRTLAYYEQDRRFPRTEIGWKKLANFYGVDVNYLKVVVPIENATEINGVKLSAVYNLISHDIPQAFETISQYLQDEGYFVKKFEDMMILAATKPDQENNVAVLIKVFISSKVDFDLCIKSLYGELASIKNLGIPIHRFWLVTNRNELITAAKNNPPTYLSLPLFMSLISGKTLDKSIKISIDADESFNLTGA